MNEPRLLVKIQVGPRCISVPGEHALIGVTGFFVREVQLLAGTPVVVQFCRGLHEVSVPGTVYAHYTGLGLSVEFRESSRLAVQRLASLLHSEDDLWLRVFSEEHCETSGNMNSMRQPELTLGRADVVWAACDGESASVPLRSGLSAIN